MTDYKKDTIIDFVFEQNIMALTVTWQLHVNSVNMARQFLMASICQLHDTGVILNVLFRPPFPFDEQKNS